jgi:hypothetical protein
MLGCVPVDTLPTLPGLWAPAGHSGEGRRSLHCVGSSTWCRAIPYRTPHFPFGSNTESQPCIGVPFASLTPCFGLLPHVVFCSFPLGFDTVNQLALLWEHLPLPTQILASCAGPLSFSLNLRKGTYFAWTHQNDFLMNSFEGEEGRTEIAFKIW